MLSTISTPAEDEVALLPQTRNVAPYLHLSKEVNPLPTSLVAPLMQHLHPHHTDPDSVLASLQCLHLRMDGFDQRLTE